MNQPMVVTNLRLPTSEYQQLKIAAGESGMSVNQYIRNIVKSTTVQKMMAVTDKEIPDNSRAFYDDMLALANSVPNVKVYDTSDDDAIIYGIYD
jgi:hypothetical protein